MIRNSIVHKIKKLFSLLVVLLSMCLIYGESADGISKIRVGYYENEVFQEGAKPGQIKKGYSYEYYRKLSEYTGWDYQYVYGDFIDLYERLEKGEIDLLSGLAYTEERAKNISFSQDPMGETRYYFLKKNSNYSISSEASSLNGKRIGVLDSIMVSVLNNWLEQNKVNAKTVVFKDSQQLFNAFDKEQVETIIIEGFGTSGRPDADVFLCVGSTDYFIGVNKKRPDVLQQLNHAQTQLETDYPNYLNSLYNKYYSTTISSRAFTEEEIEYLKNHSSITIGYLNNYLPYCDVDENGKLTGLLGDIIPVQLEKIGLEKQLSVNYQSYDSFTDMIDALQKNLIDVAFPVGGGLYFSEEGGFYQSQSVVTTSVAMVYSGEFEKPGIPSFAINMNNAMQYYYVKTYYPKAVINYYDSIEDCFEAVKSGESDYTTVNGLRVNNLLKNTKYKKLKYRLLAQADDRCYGVKIGNESLLRILNRGINAVGEQYILNQSYPYSEKLFHYSVVDYLVNALYILIPIIFVAGFSFLIYNLHTKKKLKILNIKLEAALENKERYIADMIRYASSEADADKILNQLVEYIGKNTKPDRVHVFEENDKRNFANTYEWCKQGVEKRIDQLREIPNTGVLELWGNEIIEKGLISITDIETYSETDKALYDILKPRGINTMVAVPLNVKGKVIGFLGVDNPPAEKVEEVGEFLKLVEFFFSLMIRLREGANYLENIALHDQLTGFYNRRAYHDAIEELNTIGWQDSFVFVSIDINGLKVANDTIGHEAGDELIQGACDCMSKALGNYGKLFRTGGDEFIALINASEYEVEQIKADIQDYCNNWKGELVEKLSMACGFAAAKDYPGISLHELAVNADKLMYEAKNEHYKKTGVDRRGNKDAHVALYSLYTKILKINITENTFQIIDMDQTEKTEESGYSENISEWLNNFATSGNVHSEDLEEFLKVTDLENIRKHFGEGNKTLRLIYRRKQADSYIKVMMELIPANDYSNENQTLFLYVKNID